MEGSKVLEEIGLTKGQARVYLALLLLGPSTTGQIVKEARVSRSKVYEMLDSLLEKGLVSFAIRENTKYFEAADPGQIKDYLGKKRKELGKIEDSLDQVLPQLRELQNFKKTRQTSTIYEGIKGIKTIFSSIINTLKKGDEYYAIAVEPEIYKSKDFASFIMQHHNERAKKGIKVKILAPKSFGNVLNSSIAKTKLSQIKYINQDVPTATLIFGDQVATFVWEKDPAGVVIKSPVIAQRYKKFFISLWKSVKTKPKGLSSI